MALSRSAGSQGVSEPLSTPRTLLVHLMERHAQRETQRSLRAGTSLSTHQIHLHLHYAAEAGAAVWSSPLSLLDAGVGEAGGRDGVR
jgi:hypothetical protein